MVWHVGFVLLFIEVIETSRWSEEEMDIAKQGLLLMFYTITLPLYIIDLSFGHMYLFSGFDMQVIKDLCV